MDRPKLKRDWLGARVAARHPMQNSLGKMPAGTIFTVKRVTSVTMNLESDPCPHCGVIFYVTLHGAGSTNTLDYLGKD